MRVVAPLSLHGAIKKERGLRNMGWQNALGWWGTGEGKGKVRTKLTKFSG